MTRATAARSAVVTACLLAATCYAGAVSLRSLLLAVLPATAVVAAAVARLSQHWPVRALALGGALGLVLAEVVNVVAGTTNGPAARSTALTTLGAASALTLLRAGAPALFLAPVAALVCGAMVLGAAGEVGLPLIGTVAACVVALGLTERERDRWVAAPVGRLAVPVVAGVLVVLSGGAVLLQQVVEVQPPGLQATGQIDRDITPGLALGLPLRPRPSATRTRPPTPTSTLVSTPTPPREATRPPTAGPSASGATDPPPSRVPTAATPPPPPSRVPTTPPPSRTAAPTTTPPSPVGRQVVPPPRKRDVQRHLLLRRVVQGVLGLLVLVLLRLVQVRLRGRRARARLRAGLPDAAVTGAWLWVRTELAATGRGLPPALSPDAVAAGVRQGVVGDDDALRELAGLVQGAAFAPAASSPAAAVRAWALADELSRQARTRLRTLRRVRLALGLMRTRTG